jgi:hypothetical protein
VCDRVWRSAYPGRTRDPSRCHLLGLLPQRLSIRIHPLRRCNLLTLAPQSGGQLEISHNLYLFFLRATYGHNSGWCWQNIQVYTRKRNMQHKQLSESCFQRAINYITKMHSYILLCTEVKPGLSMSWSKTDGARSITGYWNEYLNLWKMESSWNLIFLCKIWSLHSGDYKNAMFSYVTPCDSCKNRRFGGKYLLPYQSGKTRRGRKIFNSN